MPSNKILEQKKGYVAHLHDQLLEAQAGVLVDYIGITVEEDTALRRELREAGVDYKVVKNTMLHLAIQDTPYTELDSVLSGSTALALSSGDDALAPARILSKYAEKSRGKFTVKIGYMEGKVIPPTEVEALGKLPGRDGLYSMFLGAAKENMAKIARNLQAYYDKLAAQEGGAA